MIHLVTCHGVGDPPLSYAEPFAWDLSRLLQEEVTLRPIWYGDLTRYRGLRTSLAPEIDDVLDVARYCLEYLVRGRIQKRVKEALKSLVPEKTLLVTHSWGSVIACNMLPHDVIQTWVMFGSRNYFPTWFTPYPRVARWHNFWSPADILSEPWKRATNHEIPSLHHTPMWTDSHRAQWVANVWNTKDG